MKKVLLALVLTFSISLSFAQKGSITGVLLDSVDQKRTLNYATISVFKVGDSVLSMYKLSDDKGVFKIPNLQLDVNYRLVINAWQYKVLRKEVLLTASSPEINLGKLLLSATTNNLNEVEIVAERPPIIVRKDTIEFNAESFKTLPSAVVEDLLKKLPGVAVAADGSIQVNGKAVSKILVDGKEFFGGDQQIATKNLPANIIDKIQVSDDIEAKRRDPDILAGNTPQIINLKLKKAIKSGAFGKIYAGGGPRELFEAGGIMNFFRDTTQVSILGYGNNVNKPGFNMSDVMRIGGFSRTGVNSMMVNSEGAFALNGISFGGAMSGGVQKSAGSGANFNTLTKKGVKINGKYFFGYSNNYMKQLVDAEQTLGDDRLFTNTNSIQTNRSYSHNIGARIEAKLDSLTRLTFEPNVSINLARNNGNLLTKTLNTTGQLENDGDNTSKLLGNNTEYNLSSNLWKDFKKAGRSLNITLNVTRRDNLSDNFTLENSNFYIPPPSSRLLDQLRDNNIRNFNLNLNANYNEPISKSLSLSIATNSNYINNENSLATFFKNPSNQAYDIAVPTLSETVMQRGYKTNNRASLRWKVNKNLNIQPGFVFNTIDIQNEFDKNADFEQHFQFFAPQLTIRYKDLNLSYSPSFREPDVRYIQPVANNTNSLYIQNGNPNLRPSKTHQINLNIYKYDTKRTLSYNAYLGGSVQNDGIIMSRVIDRGVQTSTPVNEDGIWQFHANGNLSKDFKSNKRQFNLNTGFWSNYTKGIVIVNNIKSRTNIITFGPRVGGRLNLNDKIELSQTYSIDFSSSSYSDRFFTNLSNRQHNSDSEVIIRFPKKIVWETTFRSQRNTQSIAGMSNNIQIWNAAVTFLFMKNDRLQLKGSVNDILNTNTRRYLNISENFIRDTRTNNLGRHGLVTLTYNIQNFGGKVGGRETMFRF